MGINIGNEKQQKNINKLISNILKGAIVIAPISVTLMTLFWLFNLVDRFLPDIIQGILDFIFNGKIKIIYIPGIGFIAVIILLAFVGYVSDMFFFNRLMKGLDNYLEKSPGVKVIYSTLKDVIKNLSGSKKKFNKPVLIPFDENKKIFRMGFITKESLTELNLDQFVAVYIPMSFSIAGNVYFVASKDVKPIDNIDSGMAMKFLISGGVTNFTSTNIENQKPII